MIGRKAVIGLCLACALLVSGLAAQSALAIEGTTVVTCKPAAGGAGTGTHNDAHCKELGGGKSFEHVAVAAETTTELTGSNETTGGATSTAVLNSTQAGIAEEIVAKKVSPGAGTPWVKNRLTPNGEHYLEGEGKLLYSEVEVTKPAGKGCAVVGGAVETNQLKAHSMETGMAIKFEPVAAAEGVFAQFTIAGCTTEALNGVYKVEGSLLATPNGATLETTEAGVTTQNTLKVRGQKAGIGGSLTIKGKDAVDGSYTPLSVTTFATP